MDEFTKQLVQVFGPAGLFIIYLIREKTIERADRKEKEALDREVIKEDTASRNLLTAALASLTEVVRRGGGQ